MSGTDTFLLSSKQPLEIKPERLRTLFDTERINNKLSEVGIESSTALLSFYYLGSIALESMTRGIDMLNTDAFPIVEFHSPKYLLGPNRPDIFFDILEASYASPLNASRLGVDDTARILHRREFYSRWRIPSRVTDEMIRRTLSE
jgi:spermidine synthase